MINTSYCAVVNTTLGGQTVKSAALDLSKNVGDNQNIMNCLSVNHVIVMDILINASMMRKWMKKTFQLTFLVNMRVVEFAKIVNTTQRE